MKLLLESPRGHDEIEVPKGEEKEAVETQLKDGKWVTTEHKDGSTELLTEGDIPSEAEEEEELDDDDKELMKEAGNWKDTFNAKPKAKATTTPVTNPSKGEEWESKFEDIKSATSVSKAKGG